jgi:hypothetical protein
MQGLSAFDGRGGGLVVIKKKCLQLSFFEAVNPIAYQDSVYPPEK